MTFLFLQSKEHSGRLDIHKDSSLLFFFLPGLYILLYFYSVLLHLSKLHVSCLYSLIFIIVVYR